MANTVRHPEMAVFVDGIRLTGDYRPLSFRATFGYDQRIASAEITCYKAPTWAHPWSTVQVWAGGTPSGNAIRFAGYLIETNAALYPRAVTLVCQGPLGRVAQGRNPGDADVDLADGGTGRTDQAMVSLVLSTLNVLDGYSIDGTGRTLGTIAPDQYEWGHTSTGLEMIERLDAICVGYRTFDTPGGTILRRLISASPSDSAVLTLTEGVDLLDGTFRMTILDARNRVHVTGYDAGGGSGPVEATRYASNPYIPSGFGYATEEVSSSLIEVDEYPEVDDNIGISCGAVAAWRLAELNRKHYRVTVKTWRDDALMPGMTIRINSSDRLGINSLLWLQSFTVELGPDGAFSQEITAVGGADLGTPVQRAPVTDFWFTVTKLAAHVGGSDVTRYLVWCCDTSQVMQGSLASRAWAASAGAPASGTRRTYAVVLTSLTGVTVSLTVTDSDANETTVTKSVDVPAEWIFARPLEIASSGDGKIGAFDGATWRTYDVSGLGSSAYASAANNQQWTRGNNRVYRSADWLATSPAYGDLGDGAIAISLYADVLANDQRLLAGTHDGRVGISTDAGATWTLRDVASSVLIESVWFDRGRPDHLWALALSGLYESSDAGVTWALKLTPSAGQSYRLLAVGPVRAMIGVNGVSGASIIDSNGTAQTFGGATFDVAMQIAADPLEDVFYAITHKTVGGVYKAWRTTTPGGTAMTDLGTPSHPYPTPDITTKATMVPDPLMAGVLYMVVSGSGRELWISVDGLASSGGMLQLAQPSGMTQLNAVGVHPYLVAAT